MVLFRDFTRRTANKLGVVGFVKNLDDGSVYAVAEGEESSLNQFLSAMKKGSIFSKVSEINEKWSETSGEFNEFKIKYE